MSGDDAEDATMEDEGVLDELVEVADDVLPDGGATARDASVDVVDCMEI